ncbi:MAG: response regulator [Sneathiella sp.]|nr:response regulator [Sneathiella sp.]
MKIQRILIVEDQGITAFDVSQIVTSLGYQVTGIAMTGEDAILQADLNKPDLILMDIKLAGAMDGREAAAKIQDKYQIPVIFVTAYGCKQASKSVKTIRPEGIGYIVKPITDNELVSEINRLIG